MITVKNIQTGEIFKVSSLRVVNGQIAAYHDFAEPSDKWLSKFPYCLKSGQTILDEKHAVECRVFTLAEGYELTKVKAEKRQPKAAAIEAVAPAETSTEPTVMEEIVEPEAIVEVPAETTAETDLESIIQGYVNELEAGVEPYVLWKEIGRNIDNIDTANRVFNSACGRVGLNPIEARKQPKVQPKTKKAETPSLDAATQAFAALTPLFAGVEANVTATVMEKLEPLTSKVEAICARAPQTITHVIKTDKGSYEAAPGEVFHANFDDVCARINRGSWVYLYGPTGSGKNVMAEQVAKALGLDFHYQAHTLDRFELTGFIDASGCYQPTEFFKAYTEGGLFMLDELDASDENALVTLNSACNGYFAFPCGTVKAHPDFRCIAAGNTCGRGGTDDYTARRTMDVSSLGRFIPRYHGYCDEIDMAAAGDNEELVAFIHALRKVRSSVGCQIIASPRQIKEIVKDEAQGLNLTQTLADMFGTYLTADELNIVKQSLKDCAELDGNKYLKAFNKVRAIEY